MNEKDKKKRVQTVIVSACVIFAIFLFIGLISNLVTLFSKLDRIAKVEAQIAQLDDRYKDLGDELAYWDITENRVRYAREEKEMKYPDEIAFMGK
ncbi:MAG: septum formation initiator family protein [Firmicutes bacterium]|nr:septum formation initiator family protein [Bacillota bacterium]